MSDDEVPWLTARQKESWTGLVSIMLLMPGRLEAPLQRECGLTLFEYMVLSHLSEATERTMRMSELAFLASGSLSRLSNVVKRMESRGWVHRSPDPDDGRFTLATLTPQGYAKVEEAAPVHVRAVQTFVFDRLTATDRDALTRVASRLRILPDDLSPSEREA